MANRKKTGELPFFMEIWNEYPQEFRRCSITQQKLYTFDIRMFAHVLPKGGYPHYRLEKFNIWLMHPDIHHLQHSLGQNELIQKYPRFEAFFHYQDELRAQYNNQYLKRYNRFK